MMRYIGIGILALVGLFALGWIVEGNNFFMYKVFAPKQEQVRREVYEQTKSYHKGSTDRLSNLCGQVAAADDAQKSMLRDQISHEFSDMNTADAPDYLRSCLAEARSQN